MKNSERSAVLAQWRASTNSNGTGRSRSGAGKAGSGRFASKYRNVRTNGFASKREATIHASLKMLEDAGQLSDLRTQVTYRLDVNGEHICRYIADFVYTQGGATVVADAKGYRTDVYSLKRKLMKAIHGIEIREL